MFKSWKILALSPLVLGLFGCETLERCTEQEASINALRVADPLIPFSHRTKYSRRSIGESGQFGSVTLVDVGDDTPRLSSKLQEELKTAELHNERCLFVTVVPGCPSCAALGYAIATGTFGRVARKLRVVRIDLDEFETEARELSLPIDRVPGLFLLESTGKVRDFLDWSQWETSNLTEFASVVSKFLDGRLEQRHRTWTPEIESRAIDL